MYGNCKNTFLLCQNFFLSLFGFEIFQMSGSLLALTRFCHSRVNAKWLSVTAINKSEWNFCITSRLTPIRIFRSELYIVFNFKFILSSPIKSIYILNIKLCLIEKDFNNDLRNLLSLITIYRTKSRTLLFITIKVCYFKQQTNAMNETHLINRDVNEILFLSAIGT